MVLRQRGVIILRESSSHSELGHDPEIRGAAEFQTAADVVRGVLHPLRVLSGARRNCV